MKLVIIDDEIVICQGLAKMIESNDWGWSVASTFVNPEDALETCDWENVQCVLMDINMPDMNGIVLAKKLREMFPDIYIIFHTGGRLKN